MHVVDGIVVVRFAANFISADVDDFVVLARTDAFLQLFPHRGFDVLVVVDGNHETATIRIYAWVIPRARIEYESV